MKRFIRYTCKLTALLTASIILVGCGTLESDNPESKFDPFYDDPDYYIAGDSISGGDFRSMATIIKAYILDTETNTYVSISSGSYVPAGTYRLAIDPGMRRNPNMLESDFEDLNDLMQGTALDNRVYAGDGGNSYLVEAFLDEESGLYICNIDVDGTYTIFTLLIEVLYPDRLAKKEKIILNTRKNVRAPVDSIVKEGMGVAINTDFVKDMITYMIDKPEQLEYLLDLVSMLLCDKDFPFMKDMLGMLDKEAVQALLPTLLNSISITPGDDTMMDVSLFGGLAAMGITIEDMYEDGDVMEGGMPISMPVSTVGVDLKFLEDFVYNVMIAIVPVLTDPISLSVDSIIGPIKEILVNKMLTQAAETGMNELMINMALETMDSLFQMNMTGYGNAFAKPEENTETMSALYLGIYMADTALLPSLDLLQLSERCFPAWPQTVTVDNKVPLDLTRVKKDGIDIGVAMSGYEINSIAGQMGSLWTIPVPQSLVSGILAVLKIEGTSSNLTGSLLFDPQGITVDFFDSDEGATGLLFINGMILDVLDNGAPISRINMDAALKLNVSLGVNDNNEVTINVTLNSDKSLMRFHIFEDTLGLNFLDKSGFTKSIFDLVLRQEMSLSEDLEYILPLNLTTLAGIKAKKEGTSISSSDGNCYMTMALDDEAPMTFEPIMEWAEGCFISTVQF